MFLFLLPLRAGGAPVSRAPWVSLWLALLSIVCFAGTVLQPFHRNDAVAQAQELAVSYWTAHPYLSVPASLSKQVGEEQFLNPMDDVVKPSASVQADQQAQLNELARVSEVSGQSQLLRRLSLVPANGFRQVGWLSHIFMSESLWTLLGVLLFLYWLGPLLENAWGRSLFALSFIASGLLAGMVQAGLSWTSTVPIVGAYGAIAGMMGIFIFRFGSERLEGDYALWLLFWPRRGSFEVPAWLVAGFWAALEAIAFAGHGLTTEALVGHVAALGFGMLIAGTVRATKVEEKFIQPDVERSPDWVQHPAVLEGQDALRHGNFNAARIAFEKALLAEPENFDAEIGLSRVELALGEARGLQRFEHILLRCIARHDVQRVHEAVRELADVMDPAQMRPQIAVRTAAMLEEGPHTLQSEAERFYAGAGSHPGLGQASALMRALELRLASDRDPLQAQHYLEKLRQLTTLPSELMERLNTARSRLDSRSREATRITRPSMPRLPSFLELSMLNEEPAPLGQPKIVRGKLLEVSDETLRIESEDGKQHLLSLRNVLAVGVGMTPRPTSESPGRNVVVTDLVVAWGQEGRGPGVVRLESTALRLSALYPGMAPSQAYRQFLEHVLKRSGASSLGAMDRVMEGRFPRFDSESALNASLYGHPPVISAQSTPRF